jgi:hypothetical protein
MKFSQTQKLIFALIIFVAAGFIIYNSFFNSGSGALSSTATSTISTDGQNVVDLAYKINTISIDASLFSSPLFLNLTDFSSPLLSEPQGRPNPFAVIGTDVATQVVSISPAATSTKPAK